jgi:hypothetical protein
VAQEDSYKNYFLIFLIFLQVSMNFGSLKQFLKIKTIRKSIKALHSVGFRIRPTACGVRVKLAHTRWQSMACRAAQQRLGPAGSTAHRAHAQRARRDTVTAAGKGVVSRAAMAH